MEPPRKWRFCLVVFLRIMWRMVALACLILPEPVTLNRFLALEWVFIFGIVDAFYKRSAKVKGFVENHKSLFNIFRKIVATKKIEANLFS